MATTVSIPQPQPGPGISASISAGLTSPPLPATAATRVAASGSGGAGGSAGAAGSGGPAVVAQAANSHLVNTLAAHPRTTPALDAEMLDEGQEFDLPPLFRGLPVGLTVAVPVRGFRVRELLALDAGEVVESQWGHGEDLPLVSGAVQLAWSEFEVVDTRLAVRVTRLA